MEILLKPIVTERLNKQGEKLNTFGFVVNTKANKLQIREAVERHYNVSVASVNTLRYAGKKKSRNTKAGTVTGKRSAFKKAYITLAEGDTIDFYSNI